jgi:outer membrane protein assembly factor BamE (lipoprotein component of BamABCDE complex)
MMNRVWLGGLLLGLCAGLAACGEFEIIGVKPGALAAQVREQAGAPGLERTLADGSRYWYYVFGFSGFTTYRVHLDRGGRVIDSVQLLTERNFRASLHSGETVRDQALEALGPPGQVQTYRNLDEIVWTYRWRDATLEMLADVTFDASSGKLLGYALYRDPAYVSGLSP